MALVVAYRNRGLTRNITILDANKDAITPGANDRIRAIIGREGESPQLTVVSGSPTANGSSFVMGAVNVLRLDASDLDFDVGVWSLIIDYFDNADAQEWKNVSRQCFSLQET